MPGKRKAGGKAAGRKKMRREDDLELQDLDESQFRDLDVGLSKLDADEDEIMFNRGLKGDEDYMDASAKYAHTVEGKGEDAGMGDIDQEEGEIALEEQRERLAGLAEEDYLDDTIAAPAAKSKKRPSRKETAKDLDALSNFLAQVDSVPAEQVATDYRSLPADVRKKLLDKEAPELQAMLADFREKLTHVRTVLSPLLQKVADGELPTNAGVGFLEMKMHLFLTYLMHLTFYLLLKAEGKPVKDNPVVTKLVELRAYMDKLKPVEKKLQHQISRLLSRAALQAAGGEVGDLDKANTAALAEVDEAGGDVYQAPRGVGTGISKEEKKLREERRAAQIQKQMEVNEETQFGRATQSKRTANILKSAGKMAEEEDSGFDPMLQHTLAGSSMNRAKQGSKFKIREDMPEDEEEEEAEGEEESEDAAASEEGAIDEAEEDEEESDEGEDAKEARAFYEEELERKDQERRRKKRASNEARQHTGKREEDLGEHGGDVVDGHRKISSQITRNRGLVPDRKKKFKNPRVRSKVRASKLATKVKILVKDKKYPTNAYRGEKSIRTDVVRSHQFST